ncbi:ribosomal subunit 39S-domain-containing protein [Xylariaceae sp. FL0016]|nr:ribosomal subunit 39S-domain-containing protein [Xylariaceae sp. FL0016]
MRRVTRLGRPAGLSVTAPASRSSIAPLKAQASLQLATPRIPSSTALYRPCPARCYSSNPQPTPQSLAHHSEISNEFEDDLALAEMEGQELDGLFVPPPRRSEAVLQTQIDDPSYVPAQTSNGLETVGGYQQWWNSDKHWSKEANFTSFRPKAKVIQPALIEAAVRRAVAEACALVQAGREDLLTGQWPVGAREEYSRALQLEITSVDGTPSIKGDAPSIVDDLQRTEPTGPDSNVRFSKRKAQEHSQAWDKSWKAISLSEPRFRFAVSKRIFQLSGHLVPDHKLTDVKTVQSLLYILQKPPKPKTLTDEIQQNRQDLIELSNVNVAQKRLTRGDKAQAIGQLKLMQRELAKRDLPLYGHGGAEKYKELSRLRGGT